MKVTELTTETFKQKVMNYDIHPNEWFFEGNKPAVIDFYATWCGPCQATAPILEELAADYDGRVDFYKIDVDAQPELSALFGIRSIPSLLFIPMGEKPKMQVGAMGKAQFQEVINEHLLK